ISAFRSTPSSSDLRPGFYPLIRYSKDTKQFLTPVLIFAIYYHGNEAKIEGLLTASQVFLSIALPFAIIPLVMFTSNKKLMGEFANHTWVKYAAWLAEITV
ncbi:divalent metal cation transporter, partial [Lactiplantibacillus pentosus]|uniref:divalent metal cation transporter n=1 Tax=Lactiplantibacillus pentosus TaxID=1589 RepID=UPI0021824851